MYVCQVCVSVVAKEEKETVRHVNSHTVFALRLSQPILFLSLSSSHRPGSLGDCHMAKPQGNINRINSHANAHNQGWQLGFCCPEALMHEWRQRRFYMVRNKNKLWVLQWKSSPRCLSMLSYGIELTPSHQIVVIFIPAAFIKPDWVHAFWCWFLYLLPWPPALMVHSAAHQFSSDQARNSSTHTYTNARKCVDPSSI